MSTWYLATAWTTHIYLASSVSLSHGPQHGFGWQAGPQTPARLQAAVWTTAWLLVVTQATRVTDTAAGPPTQNPSGSMSHRRQHGLS